MNLSLEKRTSRPWASAGLEFKYLLPIAIFIGLQTPSISDPSVLDIYKASRQAYDHLSSYSDDTTRTQNFSGFVTSTHYNIELERPTFYQISWISKDGVTTTLKSDQSGVWFVSGNSAPISENSSYGGSLAWKVLLMSPRYVSLTIPDVFFGLPLNDPFLKNPVLDEKRLPDEVIAGSSCFVLTGKENERSRMTMWISKKDYLIQKVFDEDVTPPNDGAPLALSVLETHSNIKTK